MLSVLAMNEKINNDLDNIITNISNFLFIALIAVINTIEPIIFPMLVDNENIPKSKS
jgi:hypothetical protein